MSKFKSMDVGFDHDGHGYSLYVDSVSQLATEISNFFANSYEGGPVTIHLNPVDLDACEDLDFDNE